MCFLMVTGKKKICELGFLGLIPDFIRDWLKTHPAQMFQQLKDAWPQQGD